MTPQDVRVTALSLSVKSYIDQEQPRNNGSGYNKGNSWFTEPSTKDIVERAKSFEKFLNGEAETFEEESE